MARGRTALAECLAIRETIAPTIGNLQLDVDARCGILGREQFADAESRLAAGWKGYASAPQIPALARCRA